MRTLWRDNIEMHAQAAAPEASSARRSAEHQQQHAAQQESATHTLLQLAQELKRTGQDAAHARALFHRLKARK